MSQEIHIQLEKLKTELSKLEPAVKHLQDADKNTASLIATSEQLTLLAKSLSELNDKLIVSNENLLEKIDKVDFPTRLDKIDATVSAINQGMQNIQTRIGDLERNIKDDLKSQTNEIISKINTVESSFNKSIQTMDANIKEQMTKLFKEAKLQKILLFISIGIATAAVVILLLL